MVRSFYPTSFNSLFRSSRFIFHIWNPVSFFERWSFRYLSASGGIFFRSVCGLIFLPTVTLLPVWLVVGSHANICRPAIQRVDARGHRSIPFHFARQRGGVFLSGGRGQDADPVSLEIAVLDFRFFDPVFYFKNHPWR